MMQEMVEDANERLARIETKVDSLVDVDERQRSTSQDHERRIRWLEKAVWVGTGIAAAFGSLVGSAFGTVFSAGG